MTISVVGWFYMNHSGLMRRTDARDYPALWDTNISPIRSLLSCSHASFAAGFAVVGLLPLTLGSLMSGTTTKFEIVSGAMGVIFLLPMLTPPRNSQPDEVPQ